MACSRVPAVPALFCVPIQFFIGQQAAHFGGGACLYETTIPQQPANEPPWQFQEVACWCMLVYHE